MNIYFVRHGETEQNKKKTYYGSLESPLTTRGIKQGKQAGEFLKDIKFDKVYVSEKKRTHETADFILKGQSLEIIKDRRINELDFGEFEGKNFEEIKANYPMEYEAWEKNWKSFIMPKGESYEQFYLRVKAFMDDLIKDNKDKENVLVVTHGGVIRSVYTYVLGGNLDFYWKFGSHNGDVSLVKYEYGNLYIDGINRLHTPMEYNKNKIILVTGGSRSGKSEYAEKMLANEDDVLYIATAISTDGEMEGRIKKHRERRNDKWTTYEGFKNLDKVLKENTKQNVMLDCVTIMVTNLLFEEEIDFDKLTTAEIDELLEKIKKEFKTLILEAKLQNKKLIMVTNEVGCGIVPEYKLSRVFRDIAGSVNQFIAELSDEVYLVACGLPLKLK